MKRVTHTLLAGLLTGMPATAVTALIDFGVSDAPSPYNLVASNSGTVALSDTSLAVTGWSVTVVNNGSGGFGNAGAGANVSSFPSLVSTYDVAALRDSIYSNQGAGTNPAMLLTFSDLTPGGSYDLLLYGSRANAQNADQQWTLVAGAGGAMVSHPSELNSTVAVDWPGIVADGAGVISIQLNANASDNVGALALNFGSISGAASVPEPSSSLLFGLVGLALAGRRKRA